MEPSAAATHAASVCFPPPCPTSITMVNIMDQLKTMLRSEATEMLAHGKLHELVEESTKLAKEWASLEAEKVKLDAAWRLMAVKTKALEEKGKKTSIGCGEACYGAAAAVTAKTPSDVVDLNVGGHHLSVMRSTLCQVSGLVVIRRGLSCLLNGHVDVCLINRWRTLC